jgi:hypothetical protein
MCSILTGSLMQKFNKLMSYFWKIHYMLILVVFIERRCLEISSITFSRTFYDFVHLYGRWAHNHSLACCTCLGSAPQRHCTSRKSDCLLHDIWSCLSTTAKCKTFHPITCHERTEWGRAMALLFL